MIESIKERLIPTLKQQQLNAGLTL